MYQTSPTWAERMQCSVADFHPDVALSKISAACEALTFSLLTFTPLSLLISICLVSACFPSETIECNWKGGRFGPSGSRNSHYHIKVFLWITPHTQFFVGNCLWLHRAGERFNPFEMFNCKWFVLKHNTWLFCFDCLRQMSSRWILTSWRVKRSTRWLRRVSWGCARSKMLRFYHFYYKFMTVSRTVFTFYLGHNIVWYIFAHWSFKELDR